MIWSEVGIGTAAIRAIIAGTSPITPFRRPSTRPNVPPGGSGVVSVTPAAANAVELAYM